jgi:predicted dinucleotide-binding enzyme
MQITIIGAGNMAAGIATRALAGGHSVRLADRDPAKAKALAEDLRERVPGADVASADAGAGGASAGGASAGGGSAGAGGIAGGGAAQADVVVLALPFAVAEEVAAANREELAGKIVVDISNPVDFTTFDSLVVPAGTSAAEQIAAAAPGARVVKAFNTNFAGTLVAGQAGARRWTCSSRATTRTPSRRSRTWPPRAACGRSTRARSGAPASWRASSSCT